MNLNLEDPWVVAQLVQMGIVLIIVAWIIGSFIGWKIKFDKRLKNASGWTKNLADYLDPKKEGPSENSNSYKEFTKNLMSLYDVDNQTKGRLGWESLEKAISYESVCTKVTAGNFRENVDYPSRVYAIGLFWTFLLIVVGVTYDELKGGGEGLVVVIISKCLISLTAIVFARWGVKIIRDADSKFEEERRRAIANFALRHDLKIASKSQKVTFVSDPEVEIPPEDVDGEAGGTEAIGEKPDGGSTVIDMAKIHYLIAVLKDVQDQAANSATGIAPISENTRKTSEGISEVRNLLQELNDNLRQLMEQPKVDEQTR